MEITIILPAGTIIKTSPNGVPVKLQEDTKVITHPSNVNLIDIGYVHPSGGYKGLE